MSDDDPERLRPAGPALNSFELLTPSPPSPRDPFGGLSPELQERIRRKREERRAWENDPDNKEEDEFWWDVGDRGFELKMREDELRDVPATGAQAVAARNQEQRRIKAERIALKEDEREVRSAAPTEMLTTIERVRRRWDERDKIAGGLIAPEQGQDLAEHSQAPTGVDAQPAAGSGNEVHQRDVRAAPVPTLPAPAPMKHVPVECIQWAILEVYEHAQRHGMKPPNLKEIASPVQKILKCEGYHPSAKSVETIAGEPRFGVYRRKPGKRVNGTFLPFSLEGWKKSGVES